MRFWISGYMPDVEGLSDMPTCNYGSALRDSFGLDNTTRYYAMLCYTETDLEVTVLTLYSTVRHYTIGLVVSY